MGTLNRVIAGTVPLIPRPVVRRISSRYIAGETLEEAIKTVRALNRSGIPATVDVLGEGARDEEQVREYVAEYHALLEALYRERLNSGVSVKLTGLGIDVDPALCRVSLEELAEHARRTGRFVRVDMESSAYTETTLRLVSALARDHDNVGAVLQAYMRRSLDDARRLVTSGVPVRLCKGIYDEPRALAYKDPAVVRESYLLILEALLEGGAHTAIATHDEYLILGAKRLLRRMEIPPERYEFQMLLGVDEELRDILLKDGSRVRVYVPYGRQWREYSTRRLKENPAIAGYVARDVLEELTKRRNDGATTLR